MDALSVGVTLRLPNLSYAIEGAVVYRYLFHDDTATVPRGIHRLADYGGTSTLRFPAGWQKADLHRFMDEFKHTAGSLRWLVDHLDLAQLQQNHKSIDGGYVTEMDERRNPLRRRRESPHDLDRQTTAETSCRLHPEVQSSRSSLNDVSKESP